MTTPTRSDRTKMLAGDLYDPRDPELTALRIRARERCRRLAELLPTDEDGRRLVLAELFACGGESVTIEPPFHCDYGSNIRLGENVYFNVGCVVLDVCEIVIGSFTLFGPGAQIYAATHPIDAQRRRSVELGKPVRIGDDVWIGGGAIVCPGVTIGSRTVVGAGSVVTRDLPDDVVAAGNPCRVIRSV